MTSAAHGMIASECHSILTQKDPPPMEAQVVCLVNKGVRAAIEMTTEMEEIKRDRDQLLHNLKEREKQLEAYVNQHEELVEALKAEQHKAALSQNQINEDSVKIQHLEQELARLTDQDKLLVNLNELFTKSVETAERQSSTADRLDALVQNLAPDSVTATHIHTIDLGPSSAEPVEIHKMKVGWLRQNWARLTTWWRSLD